MERLMRPLQDDFHVIKYSGLNSASNCSKVEQEESACTLIELLFTKKRETADRI